MVTATGPGRGARGAPAAHRSPLHPPPRSLTSDSGAVPRPPPRSPASRTGPSAQHPAPTAPVFTSDARPPRSRTCYLGPPPPAPPPKHWRGRERAGAEGATAARTNPSPSCVLAHALIGSSADRPSSNGYRPSSNGCRPGAVCGDFPFRQARWSQRESGGKGRSHGG